MRPDFIPFPKIPRLRFATPEGVVVYMQSSGSLHKVLLEGDELPKGASS